jgi:hypothetical protein
MISTEKLEAEVLRMITKIHHVSGLVYPLQKELMQHRAKLRNLLHAYKLERTEAEIDDLMFAIIRDDALTLDDIRFVFDLNESLFVLAIERMRERDRR